MNKILVAALTMASCLVSVFAQAPLLRSDSLPQLVTNNIPLVNKALSAITAGGAVSNDGGGGVWVYFTNSVLATNAYAIYQPTGSVTNGRWVRLEGGVLLPPTNQEVGFIGSTLKIDGSVEDRLQFKVRGTNTLQILSNMWVNVLTGFKFNDGLTVHGVEMGTNYTINPTQFFIGNTNSVTNTLPPSGDVYRHQIYVIKSDGANVTTTVYPSLGDAIDGATNDTIRPFESTGYIIDAGTNWMRAMGFSTNTASGIDAKLNTTNGTAVNLTLTTTNIFRLTNGGTGTNAIAVNVIPRSDGVGLGASALSGSSNTTTNTGTFSNTGTFGSLGAATFSSSVQASNLVVNSAGGSNGVSFNLNGSARAIISVDYPVTGDIVIGSTAAGSGYDVTLMHVGAKVARIDSSGYFVVSNRLGVGMSPTHALELSTDDAQKPTTATWNITSDEKTKKNIAPYEKGLAEILQLHPIEYDHNGVGGTQDGQHGIGFTAQDVEKVFPESVKDTQYQEMESKVFDEIVNDAVVSRERLVPKYGVDPIAVKTLNLHAIIIAQVKAIQELEARIKSLESK